LKTADQSVANNCLVAYNVLALKS